MLHDRWQLKPLSHCLHNANQISLLIISNSITTDKHFIRIVWGPAAWNKFTHTGPPRPPISAVINSLISHNKSCRRYQFQETVHCVCRRTQRFETWFHESMETVQCCGDVPIMSDPSVYFWPVFWPKNLPWRQQSSKEKRRKLGLQ